MISLPSRGAEGRKYGLYPRVTLLGLIHFLVDFACIFLLVGLMPVKDWWLYALLYAFFAFGMQLPWGILGDLCKRRFFYAAMGCALIIPAFFLAQSAPYIACFLMGTGNALFHVGGGIYVMNALPQKAAPLGFFIAPGAFGVFFGSHCAALGTTGLYLGAAVMALCSLLLIFFCPKETVASKSALIHSYGNLRHKAILALLLLLLAVGVRSYFGLILSFSWRAQLLWGFLFIFGVASGKAVGGFLADRLGLSAAALGSLALSALLFLFAFASPVPGVAAIFCFNMTMPITLFAMGQLCGDCKGFAFGMASFGLFLGTLPTLFPAGKSLFLSAGITLLIGASAALILGGLALMRRILP